MRILATLLLSLSGWIANEYGTVSKGRDQQLEKAVETLLKELK
ncbi:hypothetical protein [Rhodoflexus sp.]